MELSDFSIDGYFTDGRNLWRCTDIGSRTILAIRLNDRREASVVDGKRQPDRVVDLRSYGDQKPPGWPEAFGQDYFDIYDLPAFEPVTDPMAWRPCPPSLDDCTANQPSARPCGCAHCAVPISNGRFYVLNFGALLREGSEHARMAGEDELPARIILIMSVHDHAIGAHVSGKPSIDLAEEYPPHMNQVELYFCSKACFKAWSAARIDLLSDFASEPPKKEPA